MDMYGQNEGLEKEVKKYKRLSIVLAILVVILACVSIYALTHVREYAVTVKESESTQMELQRELDSILREYETMKNEYGEINEALAEKDSAILAQAAEIERLINSQADYRRIKKKLELLQNQGKEYVKLLDSLYVVNAQLTNENKGLVRELGQINQEKESLKQERESLQQQVNIAAKIKAYNVSLKAYTNKDVETDKAKRVKKLKTHFLLGENNLAEVGNMNVYARISLPDGRVLAIGNEDAYSFFNEGKRLQYTVKEVVYYEKTSKQLTLSWALKPDDAAVAGTYYVQLFTDEDFIGEASLTLK